MKLAFSRFKGVLAEKSLSSRWVIFFLAVALAVYFIRGHEYILQSQLYAEDGTIWLAQGYNLGFESLTLPYNAFFHTWERVIGLLIAQMPLQAAPLLFNLTAWGIFGLLAYYLFSPRTNILTNNYQRIFVLICIGLVANVDELFFNFSNSVFLLGIIGALILIADEPKSMIGKVIERIIYFLSCFTLVFVWFYLPIVLIEKFKYKRPVNFYLIVATIGSVVQLASYLTTPFERSMVTVKALLSKYTVLEIYNQIITPVIRFSRADVTFDSSNIALTFIVFLVVALAIVAVVYVARKANKQVQYLLLFFAAMTAASLKSPLVDSVDPIKFMTTAAWGDRYFIFGIIGLGIVLAKLPYELLGSSARRWFLAGVILLGVGLSWQTNSFFIHKYFQDYRNQYQTGIEQLEKGSSKVSIPINPGWQMELERQR